jgi:heparosan-N-sulfate-glucuronate 5-epimerase
VGSRRRSGLLAKRAAYYRRIFSAYLTRGQSQLTFWQTPTLNPNLRTDSLGEYYMTFFEKADYPGVYDESGIPLLDYRGDVGLRYNPIAIAQYALGNYNLLNRTGDERRRIATTRASDWLVSNLEENEFGVLVWNHHFDWEYRTPLKDPWYSALAQGQALSALVRAHAMTSDPKYLETAERGFDAFTKLLHEGGVTYVDPEGYYWLEETIVDPPTHILNGFLWASWGLYDLHLHTGNERARELFDESVRTLVDKLVTFDAGFWSLYEQSGTRLRMLTSPFYHRLHIVQLEVMARLTGEPTFGAMAARWERFAESGWRKALALGHKSAFKLLYY